MGVSEAVEGTKEVIDGLNSLDGIKNSNVIFAKEALSAAANVGDSISPFIPLIGAVATLISEIVDIYETAQYNKKICNSLLDRARLAEIAIDNLIRRRRENEHKFKEQAWYEAFNRFVDVLEKVKNFAGKISKLKGIRQFVKARTIKERFEVLTTEFDDIMKDLNFTIAIANQEQQRIDHKSLKDDLAETAEFLKKIDVGVEGIDVKLSLIYEEVKNTRQQLVVKKIEPTEITDPDVGKEDDKRGSKPRFIKRKFYMKGIEVACKPIKGPEERVDKDKSKEERAKEERERIMFERHMAILMKVSQSPNILRFYGLSEIDGEKVMILEWAKLGSLKEVYKRKISLQSKLSYALHICRGIAYLNALDIYHHDLRCKNIMVTEYKVAKLANFDLARRSNATTTSIKSQLERTRWLAPEKLKEQGYRYDHKCEIFSFGMLLWELAFEKKPYKDSKIAIDKISDHVIAGNREEIKFEGKGNESEERIQKGYEKIIKDAWHHVPDMRITISKLLIDLDQLEQLAQSTTTTGSPSIQPQKSVGNNNFAGNDDDDDDDDGIPEYETDLFESLDIIESAIEPLISITDGVKAHRNKDHEKAWKCFDRQAENGNRKGKYWKAHYLWEGIFVNKDKISAIKLFKEAADDGSSDAQLRYAFCLPDKDLRELNLNPKDSVKYLKLAAESGSDTAQFHVGDAYLKGKLGFNKDFEVAKLWFKRSAIQQNKYAIKRLQELNVNIEDV